MTEKPSIELEPCLVCGGEARLRQVGYDRFSYECTNPNCNRYTRWNQSIDGAAAAWNHPDEYRAAEMKIVSQSARIIELEEQIDKLKKTGNRLLWEIENSMYYDVIQEEWRKLSKE